MKKIFFTFSFLCLLFSIQAQFQFSPFIPLAKKEIMTYALYPAGEDGYISLGYASISLVGKNAPMKEITISIPKGYFYITSFDNEEEVFALYSSYGKKEDAYNINLVRYSKSGTHFEFKPKVIASVYTENRDKVKEYFSISDDKSKIAYSVIVTDKKSMFKNLFSMVLNQDGEILWEKSHTPTFNNSTFYIDRSVVSDDGEIFFCVRSDNPNTRGSAATDETLHLMKIDEDGFELFKSDVTFGYIKSMDLKLLKNGDIFIGGYYSTTYKASATGFFSTIFDMKKLLFTPIYNKSIADELTLKNPNIPYSILMRAIREMDNGNILMFGEEQLIVRTQTSQGTSTTYNSQAIFCHAFSRTGEEISSNTIIKKQVAVHPQAYALISFGVLQKENEIYLLMNDHIDNYGADVQKKKNLNFEMSAKKAVTALHKITSDGEITAEILDKPEGKNLFLSEILYSSENKAVLLYEKRNNFRGKTITLLTF